jgi:hypothetical protein
MTYHHLLSLASTLLRHYGRRRGLTTSFTGVILLNTGRLYDFTITQHSTSTPHLRYNEISDSRRYIYTEDEIQKLTTKTK